MSITVILGGASSGKTRYAQNLAEAESLAEAGRKDGDASSLHNQRWHYVATARLWDDEMRAKAKAHRQQRAQGRVAWRTHEIDTELAAFFTACRTEDVVLVDSIGMWLSNVLLDGGDLLTAQVMMTRALADCAATIFLIADEVGMGLVPEQASSRRFRVINGECNQALCQMASRVDFVVSGLAQRLK